MNELRDLSISGRIATPRDPDWDEARAGWNLAADQKPTAVAFVESADDVATTIDFANSNGLRVAGQGTGHGAVALEPLDDTILIKTERMRGIGIDPERRMARVEAGVLVTELSEAAGEHGLSSMPGSSPDVGVIGFCLGGGLSWLGRRHGFACNRVRAVEVVTAAGERRKVDAETGSDLFWALRGGGGGYAIVTALHIELLPLPDVYAGVLVFPAELGEDAVLAYRDWAAGVSEDVTSVVRFITPPPLPDVPEPIRGKPLLTIDGACIGDRERGEATIAPLRELGEPIMDTFGQIPAAGLCRIHMDPEHPVPGLGHHKVLRELPDEAVAAFTQMAGIDSGSPLLLTEIRQLGGALGRLDPEGGALTHLDAEFVLFGVGMLMAPEMRAPVESHLDATAAAMEPWAADGGYFNFAERPCDADAILPADVCARLLEVKRKWDPEGMIVSNHALAIAPA